MMQRKDNRKIIVRNAFLRVAETLREWDVPIADTIILKDEIVDSPSFYAVTHYDEEKHRYEVTVSELIWKEYKRRPSEALRYILMHELCHTIDGCFNHGKKWRQWVERLNEEHGTKINPHPFSAKPTDLF